MRGAGYVVRRCGYALLTLFVAFTFNFVLFRALPGDAVSNVARLPGATAARQAALRHNFGLDKSKWEQYFIYLKQLAHGNLGVSFENSQPVLSNLTTALLNTLPMIAIGTLLSIVLGIVSGVWSAWRRGGMGDTANTSFAIVLYSLPVQWLGLVLLGLFAGVLPAGGMSDPFLVDPSFGTQALDYARHVALPALTFAITLYGQYALIVRSSMLETLGEDYVLTARAKGLRPWLVLRRHALRNAMLPTSTLIALSIGYIVAGSILIETVFSWPGIGRAVYEAVLERDYPMLQGAFLLLAISVIVANLIVDLLYARLDPRVKA